MEIRTSRLFIGNLPPLRPSCVYVMVVNFIGTFILILSFYSYWKRKKYQTDTYAHRDRQTDIHTIWPFIYQRDFSKGNTNIFWSIEKKNGFNEPLTFIAKTNASNNNSKKQRKRKVIWFSSPFSLKGETSIGRTFLKLLKQRFPKSNRLQMSFNKNTVKVSYTCMNYMPSIISSHNKRLLIPGTTKYGWNCRKRQNCPLQNQCLTPNLIYRAYVENNANKGTKIYFGLAETSFKERFRNHNKDFNLEQWRKSTELLKYMWPFKEQQVMPRIRWSIVEKLYGKTKINFCPLCLAKKFHPYRTL